jgi:hypothetical protein
MEKILPAKHPNTHSPCACNHHLELSKVYSVDIAKDCGSLIAHTSPTCVDLDPMMLVALQSLDQQPVEVCSLCLPPVSVPIISGSALLRARQLFGDNDMIVPSPPDTLVFRS